VEHSLFENNITDGLLDGGGGHVFQNGPDRYVIFRNSTFRNGQSLGLGRASGALGKDANYLFEFCSFINNASERAGGAVNIANAFHKNPKLHFQQPGGNQL
jgi:hypothetical protein